MINKLLTHLCRDLFLYSFFLILLWLWLTINSNITTSFIGLQPSQELN